MFFSPQLLSFSSANKIHSPNVILTTVLWIDFYIQRQDSGIKHQ